MNKEHERGNIFSKYFLEKIKNHSSDWLEESLKKNYLDFLSKQPTGYDFLDWVSYSGFITSDVERFLFRSDRIGMNNSIELRSPFLSNDIVKFSFSIPSNYKIRKNIPKYIFKKSLEEILPEDILYRRKKGFCLPLGEWAADTICNYVDDNLKSFNKNFNLFNEENVRMEVRKLKGGYNKDVNKIWSYYFFMNWYEKWG